MNLSELITTITGMLLVAAVVSSPVACTMVEDQLIAEAIRTGHDPLEVKCALGSDVKSVCMKIRLERR